MPNAVDARLARFQTTRARSSLVSAAAATGLRAVGFESTGDVMGCTSFALSRVYPGGCGIGRNQRPVVRLGGRRWSGYESYLGGLRKGYDIALRRLRTEAVALGADGVVGVRLQVTEVADATAEANGARRHDFVALGTAVRSRGRKRPDKPFATTLPGTDVAKLLFAGWLPVDLCVVIEIGLRHNDPLTFGQAQSSRVNRTNVEVSGFTEVAQAVRQSVRRKFATRVGSAGASGGLLQSIATSTWHSPCGISLSDQVVQAVAIGDAIARFGPPRPAGPAPLAVLPLTGGNS